MFLLPAISKLILKMSWYEMDDIAQFTRRVLQFLFELMRSSGGEVWRRGGGVDFTEMVMDVTES